MTIRPTALEYRLGELIGHHVVVENPNGSSKWRGFAVAGTLEPTITIDQADGKRISLMLAWAQIDEPMEAAVEAWKKIHNEAPENGEPSWNAFMQGFLMGRAAQ